MWAAVTYNTDEARQQLLDTVADAADDLGEALALLTEAYEELDERMAERVEQELFRPVQSAYGRAQRAHAGFAARHQLPPRTFAPAAAVGPGHGVKGLLEDAAEHVGSADQELAALQDSMLPVEVGDVELRADLEQVRAQLDHLRARARELVRAFGR